MDLHDYIKQEQEKIKQLEAERAQQLAQEGRTLEGASAQAKDAPPELAPPSGPEMLQTSARTIEVIDGEIKEARNCIAGAESVLSTPFVEKFQEMVVEQLGLAANALGSFVHDAGPAMLKVGIEGFHTVEPLIPEVTGHIVETLAERNGTPIPPDVAIGGELLLEQLIDQLPETWDAAKREYARNAELVKGMSQQAVEKGTQTLDGAWVLPNAEEKLHVIELGETQKQEREALDKNIGMLEKRFEEKFAGNPQMEEIGKQLQEKFEALRLALQDKQEREIKQELNIALMQLPLR